MTQAVFKARIAEVLGWDQKECSVLLLPGGPGPAEFMRSHRGATVEVTVTVVEKQEAPPAAPPPPQSKTKEPQKPKSKPAQPPQPTPAKPAEQHELFGKGRRWGA